MIPKTKSDADVIVSAGMEETDFSIDENNLALIFEILRNKMYQDPIGSICREILSNSRDAHREAGKPDLPVEVEISDARHSIVWADGLNIVFRDLGVGISPERIRDVYAKYGASTKRETNEQTGGFGLGAKTPLAYSDSFSVHTVVDGHEYVYSIYIDPSGKGKIALLHDGPVERGNSTQIIVPLKPQDRHTFEAGVLRASHFWPVRPKLFNFDSSWEAVTRIKDADGKALIHSADHEWFVSVSGGITQNRVAAVVDGILYPVNIDHAEVRSVVPWSNASLCLRFGNGEVSVSANRENLHYDKATKALLRARIDAAVEHTRAAWGPALAGMPTLGKAISAHRSMINNCPLYPHLWTNGRTKPKYKTPSGTEVDLSARGLWHCASHLVEMVEARGSRARRTTMGMFDAERVLTASDDGSLYLLPLGAPWEPWMTRALLQRHRYGFVLVTQLQPEEERTLADGTKVLKPRPGYEAGLMKDGEHCVELGLELLDPCEVERPPSAARPQRTKAVAAWAFNSITSDERRRVSLEKNPDGTASTPFGGTPVESGPRILMSEAEIFAGRFEYPNPKSAMKKFSAFLRQLDPRMTLFVCAKTAHVRMVKSPSFVTLRAFIEGHQKLVGALYGRYVNAGPIGDHAEFSGLPLEGPAAEAVKALSGIEQLPFVDFSGMEVGLTAFGADLESPARLPSCRPAVEKQYPLLDSVDSDAQAAYVRLANRLALLEEKLATLAPTDVTNIKAA